MPDFDEVPMSPVAIAGNLTAATLAKRPGRFFSCTCNDGVKLIGNFNKCASRLYPVLAVVPALQRSL
jgi:hypothetical protein